MTTTNASRNGSEDIQEIEITLDQEDTAQLLSSEETTAFALDSEDIEQHSDVSSLESALAQPSISLPRSGKSLPKRDGKRAFAVANRMAQATGLENLYQIAVTESRKRFSVERSLIYRFTSETQGTVIAESLSAGYSPMLGESVAAIAFGAADARSYKQQSSVAISDASESAVTPHQMRLFNHFQVQASLSLPIFLEDQLWGLLVMQQCSAPRVWNEQEISFLYLIATELQVNLQPLNFQAERELFASLSNTLCQTSDAESVF